MSAELDKVEAALADAYAEFYDDPLGFVMFNFPWDTEKSIQQVKLSDKYRERYGVDFGPDQWAIDFLEDLGKQVRKRGFDGIHAVEPIQYTTASGHGIGKSVLCAWIILWIMSTRPQCRGTVTANTDVQLRTKTWATLGTWLKLALNQHWFTFATGRGAMRLSKKEQPESWFCQAQTCREENSESFAGQHASNSTSFYIFDEASAVPDKIFEVREGGLVTGEPMTFDFGNPTRNTGKFYENTAGKQKHRHIVRQIDSRSVQITNKKLHARWIADYGIDSDFVKVRVRGEFPSQGSAQFIPTEYVTDAMLREANAQREDPLILGVDVARYGDDESVIYPRIGMDARSWPARRYRGLSTMQLVAKVVDCIRDFAALGKKPSAIFIDGTGLGGGVVDRLLELGYNVTEVQFGSKPGDTFTYRYKSDEMWGAMKDALQKRLCLPDGELGMQLKDQLTQREFGYTLQGNKIHLETKADMKERLGGDFASPDIADALALTFAMPVAAEAVGSRDTMIAPAMQVQHEYDPYKNI